MPVISKTITAIAPEPTPVRERIPGVWRCLEIRYGENERVFSLSHQEAKAFMPTGAVFVGALKSSSDISQNCGYLTGRATITAPSYTLVDKDSEVTNFLKSKNDNGRGSLGVIVREYEWPAWSPFPVNSLVEILMRIEAKGTWQLENHTWSAGGNIVLQCKDINRGLDKEILNPYQWKLTGSISDTVNFIPTDITPNQIAEQDVFFTRGQHYNAHPNERGCYLELSTDEIVFATGLEERAGVVGFVLGGRGEFNTIPEAISIADDVEPTNYPTILEYIVIDEPIQTMAYALCVGETFDGRVLPRHWSAGIDSTWINRYSYALYANPFRLEFRNPGKQVAKRWIESQVLSADTAVHAIDNQGRLTWTPVVTPTDTAAGQIRLDKDNCQNSINYVLRHDKTSIHSSVSIEYNHNENNPNNKFESRVIYDNPFSSSFNEVNKATTHSFEGIRDGIHTSGQVRKLGIAIGDDNYYEKQFLEVECLIPDIRLGSLVAVDFPHIRDDMGNTGALKRTMIVTASSERRSDRVTRYTLTGTQQIAADTFAGQAQHNLPVEEYMRDGIDITTLPGVTLTAGRLTGSMTLTMGQKYYYVNEGNLGDGVQWGPGLTVNIAGTGPAIQWWCFGPWVNNADFSLAGRSDNQGGAGQTTDTPQMVGDPGMIASGSAGGSLKIDRNFTTRSVTNDGNSITVYTPRGDYQVVNRPSRISSTSFPRVPPIVLDANNGRLGGLPANLGGMGGLGGPVSLGVDTDRHPQFVNDFSPSNPQSAVANGSAGGTGGGAFVSVTWGGVNNGVITTSGGRPITPPSASITGQSFYGGEGAGGAPGAWLWIVDGNHPAPVISGSNFIAQLGQPWVPGVAASNQRGRDRDSNIIRSNLTPTFGENLWNEAHRILYTPASETVQSVFAESIFSSLAISRQQDGKIELIVTSGNTPPSNGLPGDMAIPQAQLDNVDNPEPFAWVMNDARKWEQINWATAAGDYTTLLEVNRRFGGTESILSATRPEGAAAGTHWLDSSTGAEWILGATPQEDRLFRDNGVSVGEELLNDPNFALYGQGIRHWVFTRDADYQPLNLLDVLAQEILDAFITHGQVEGEFGAPSTAVSGVDQVPPPVSMGAVAISPTEISVDWVQPADTTGILSQEVLVDTVPQPATSKPFLITGRTPEQVYNIRVRNVGASDTRSTSVSTNVTMPPAGGVGGQIGIVLTDTGRTVSGTAYQDNASIPIEQGREIRLTLDNGTFFLSSVGANGAFTFNVPSSADGNLNKLASIYTNNGSGENEAQLTFTYEL